MRCAAHSHTSLLCVPSVWTIELSGCVRATAAKGRGESGWDRRRLLVGVVVVALALKRFVFPCLGK